MKKLLLVLALWFAFAGAALATVNINSATKEELVSLKGVGDKKAQAIIDYRKKNGDFKSIDDLEKVDGIGPGIMKQIRAQISVSGKTTIDKPEKATKAKEKVAEKSKSDDKPKTAMKDEKSKGAVEKKAETKKAPDTKVTKDEKKAEKK